MTSFLHSLAGLMVTVAVPIVALVGGLSFAAYSMYLRVRRQRETLQMHHAERMAAIEKGIELPPLPPESLYGVDYRGETRHTRRGRAVTLLFVGAAITVALWQTGGDHRYWWGLVIIALGLGRLVGGYLEDTDRGPYPGPTSGRPGTNGGPASGLRWPSS